MVYIERNEQNKIISLSLNSNLGHEAISEASSELIEFIKSSPNEKELTSLILNRLDLDMVRVIEDVLDIMIDRNLMLFTDLPEPVQNKLIFKRKIRNLSGEKSILEEEGDFLNL